MKKIFISSLIFLAITGCSKNDTIQFCEGVDMDGKGVNCGKKFTTGDLTGVIKQSKPFEAEMLDVKVIRIEKNSKIVEKTIHLKVERDRNIASTPLSFYNTGKYVVEIYKDKDKLGESEIEVTD
jgi:cytochrome c556